MDQAEDEKAVRERARLCTRDHEERVLLLLRRRRARSSNPRQTWHGTGASNLTDPVLRAQLLECRSPDGSVQMRVQFDLGQTTAQTPELPRPPMRLQQHKPAPGDNAEASGKPPPSHHGSALESLPEGLNQNNIED